MGYSLKIVKNDLFIIYNLSCPSASFLAPLDSAHGVALVRCILMSALLHVACCARMLFSYLIAMRPAITVVVRCFDGSLSLSSRFALALQCRDLILELSDLRVGSLELSGKFGIGRVQCCHCPTI
jgi:hypothetical protein